MGGFCVPKLLVGGFGCDELVLYGIRELAQRHYEALDIPGPIRVEKTVTNISVQ